MDNLMTTGACNFVRGLFKALRIILSALLFVLIGCSSDPNPTFKNGSFSQWENGNLTGWSTPFLATTSVVLIPDDTAVQFSGSIGKSTMGQRISVSTGKFYIIKGNIESYEGKDWNVGLWVEGKGSLGYHVLEMKSFDNPTQVKIKFQADQHFVDIKLGFQKFGAAKAIFNNFTFRESTNNPGLKSTAANQIKGIVPLAPFDSLNLHNNVLLLTEYGNFLN